jgi:hypothetical protein
LSALQPGEISPGCFHLILQVVFNLDMGFSGLKREQPEWGIPGENTP